ncbi:MAG: hypothetical protein ACOCV1_06190 [Bacillota bacterium]
MTNYSPEQYLIFPQLGKLSLFDILVENSGYPVIFVCKDAFESMFLFYEVDYDRLNTHWLVSKIIKDQYLKLKKNEESLKKTFERSYSGNWYLIKENAENKKSIVEVLTSFPETFFPYKDEIYVGINNEEDYALEELFKESFKLQEAFFDVRLKNNSNNNDYVSINPSVLVKIADSVRLLFKKFVIPEESIKLQLVKGSTVVRFSFADVNLFIQEDSSKVLQKINKAMSSNDSNDIFNAFEGDKEKIKKYKTFIDSIRLVDKDIEISAVTPNKNVGFVKKINDEYIKRQFNYLDNIYFEEKQETRIIGELYSINTKTKKVEFYDESKKIIKADLDIDVKKNEFIVPKTYTFNMIINNTVDSNGNIKSSSYRVNSIHSLE